MLKKIIILEKNKPLIFSKKMKEYSYIYSCRPGLYIYNYKYILYLNYIYTNITN